MGESTPLREIERFAVQPFVGASTGRADTGFEGRPEIVRHDDRRGEVIVEAPWAERLSGGAVVRARAVANWLPRAEPIASLNAP